MEEFEVGDIALVMAPDEDLDWHDTDVFNVGWAEGDMEQYIGQTGEIVEIDTFYGLPGYCMRFSDGAMWWWDPRYMFQKTEKESSKISIDDFDSILN